MRGELCEHNLPIDDECIECMKDILRNYRTWYSGHFEDFSAKVNAQLLELDNEAGNNLLNNLQVLCPTCHEEVEQGIRRDSMLQSRHEQTMQPMRHTQAALGVLEGHARLPMPPANGGLVE